MEIHAPSGHLDQMIRQTRAHHVQLSSMADMKANMMLTVSSLMIPLSIRYVSEPRLQWAAITMIGFCVLTVALAAYAAMPKVGLRRKQGKPSNLDDPFFNILFFGGFAAFEYDEFKQAMEGIMNDHNRAYEVQLREVYSMGHYLARKKYRFIRLAYLAFIAGVMLSAVVCSISFLY